MIGFKTNDICKKIGEMVEFYSHIVASTPEDRSSCCRIWHYDKSSFPSMCTASFLGFLTSGCCTRCHCSDLLYNSQLSTYRWCQWWSALGRPFGNFKFGYPDKES